MIASEQGGRGANEHRGRSAFRELKVQAAMQRLLALGGVEARSERCALESAELHYLTAGAGAPMLLLHGAGGGAANWYRLMAPLSRSFRVIAVDLPGFGLSDPIEPQPPLGLEVARIVDRLLNTIMVRPVHIVGTSFGGLVALRLAQMRRPHTLTLIDSAGLWPDASLELKLACFPFIQRLGVKQSLRGARWILRHVLTARRLQPEHEAALAEYIFASAAFADSRVMARAYSLFAGLHGQFEVVDEDEFDAIGPRTLIIWGEKDRFLPAPPARHAFILAAGARLRIIPGAGHSPNWEMPDEVLETMFDFVRSRGGSGE